MLQNLSIDPEFQSKIPPLTAEERSQLESNILEEGRIISPLIVWNGLIVDGHNRFDILKQHPEIEYTVLEKEFANRYEAIVWICKNQLGRRNLTPEQRKYLIGKQYEAEKVSRGGERSNSHMRDENGMFTAKSQNVTLRCDEGVIKRIADENNVSRMFVFRAEDFSQGVDAADEAVPGTRDKILSGKVKPTAAELAAVSRAAPEERPGLVAEICRPRQEKRTAREKQAAQEKIDAQEAESPLPELPKPNSGRRSQSRRILESIREISEKMLQPTGEIEEEDIFAEMEDALDTLIFRWNTCLQNNPALCLSGLEGIRRIGEQGMDFIKNFEQSIRKANTG